MSERPIKIKLDSVNYDELQTEDDFRLEVARLLPNAMTQAGMAIAIAAWKGDVPTLSQVPSQKERFIQETVATYLADSNERERLEQHLMQKLKSEKCRMESQGDLCHADIVISQIDIKSV